MSESAGDLARGARAITEEVLAAQKRGELLDFGNAAMPRVTALATALGLLAQAVEQLAENSDVMADPSPSPSAPSKP